MMGRAKGLNGCKECQEARRSAVMAANQYGQPVDVAYCDGSGETVYPAMIEPEILASHKESLAESMTHQASDKYRPAPPMPMLSYTPDVLPVRSLKDDLAQALSQTQDDNIALADALAAEKKSVGEKQTVIDLQREALLGLTGRFLEMRTENIAIKRAALNAESERLAADYATWAKVQQQQGAKG